MEMSPPALMATMKASVPDIFFGDSPEIAHELVLRRANTTILGRNSPIGLVRNEFDDEVWLDLDFHWYL